MSNIDVCIAEVTGEAYIGGAMICVYPDRWALDVICGSYRGGEVGPVFKVPGGIRSYLPECSNK